MTISTEQLERMEAYIPTLEAKLERMERRLTDIEHFLNKAFNTSIPAGTQYAQPNDRTETGMGAIVSADRSSFI